MSNFLRNIFKLASGSVIGQIISVLLIPIISRLYLPDDFGVLQQFISILSIIVVFSMGSYQLAIILPSKENDAENIFLLCIFLLSVTTIIVSIFVFFFSEQIAVILFNEPKLSAYLFFLPLAVFIDGIFIILNYWYTRKKQFGLLAIGGILNASSTKIIQIGSTRLIPSSPLGLILGIIAGYATSVVYMVGCLRDDFNRFRKKMKTEITHMAIRYKEFPRFSVWSQLCNQVSIQVPTFLLSFFYSTTIVGYYSMANMAINMPMILIGGAISQVFFQRANEEKLVHGHSKKVVSEVHHLLLAVGVLPIIVLMILGSDIFLFIFGANWITSGVYAAILGPFILFVFIAAPLSSLYSIYEKQNVGLVFNVLLLSSRFISLYIGGLLGDPIFCLTLFSITGIIFWVWNNFYLIRLAGLPIREEIRPMVRYILQGICFGLPILLLRLITDKIYILLPIAGALIILYYVFLIKKDTEIQYQLRSLRFGDQK